jgi:molybdopterin-guanine dinucleotide biosynthesis protein A
MATNARPTEEALPAALACEVCILAGGLSRRMGRDKARLRLGRRTMLGHVRAAAGALDLPIHVIRRDAVRRCGPLGGIYTALRTTRADAVIFLACDMPFVSHALLRRLRRDCGAARNGLFVRESGRTGFPCILPRAALPVVADAIAGGRLSLQTLAKRLNARSLRLPWVFSRELRNVNTPADWQRVRKLWDNHPTGNRG